MMRHLIYKEMTHEIPYPFRVVTAWMDRKGVFREKFLKKTYATHEAARIKCEQLARRKRSK